MAHIHPQPAYEHRPANRHQRLDDNVAALDHDISLPGSLMPSCHFQATGSAHQERAKQSDLQPQVSLCTHRKSQSHGFCHLGQP